MLLCKLNLVVLLNTSLLILLWHSPTEELKKRWLATRKDCQKTAGTYMYPHWAQTHVKSQHAKRSKIIEFGFKKVVQAPTKGFMRIRGSHTVRDLCVLSLVPGTKTSWSAGTSQEHIALLVYMQGDWTHVTRALHPLLFSIWTLSLWARTHGSLTTIRKTRIRSISPNSLLSWHRSKLIPRASHIFFTRLMVYADIVASLPIFPISQTGPPILWVLLTTKLSFSFSFLPTSNQQ